MRLCLLLLLLASPVHAVEPEHKHCWHELTGTVVRLEPVCCHCGKLKGCVGHGPHKPGCAPARSDVFPYLLKDPEELRYNYDYGG